MNYLTLIRDKNMSYLSYKIECKDGWTKKSVEVALRMKMETKGSGG